MEWPGLAAGDSEEAEIAAGRVPDPVFARKPQRIRGTGSCSASTARILIPENKSFEPVIRGLVTVEGASSKKEPRQGAGLVQEACRESEADARRHAVGARLLIGRDAGGGAEARRE